MTQPPVTTAPQPGSSRIPAAEARVLFVHAHPDDESILTGGTMASLAAAGAQVVLLTATRGEGGEVIGAEYAHLEGDRAALAAHREVELAAAMEALGVTDHRLLGDGPAGGAVDGRRSRRFEDSGMAWGPDGHATEPADMPAAALCRVPASEVADYIGAVIAEVRPHLVITYADGGGYGHPDHRHVHRATVLAVEGVAQPQRPKLLFADIPASAAAAAFDPGRPGFDLTGFAPVEQIPTIAAEAPIVVAQDVTEVYGAKAMAMAAHQTQVTVAGEFFALSNGIGQHIADVEYYSDPDLPRPASDDAAGAPHPHVLDVVPRPVEAVGVGAGSDSGAQAGGRRNGIGATIHAVLIGLLIGALGSFQHLNATAVDLAGQEVVLPWGVVISLALSLAGLWHIATLYRSAGLMVLTAIVISLVGFLLGQPGILPGSDLVVTGSLRSLAWLFGPMIMAAIMAFTLPALKRPRSDASRFSASRPTDGTSTGLADR
jgi:N-acetyl-1-D-myo-inositol-2-amino-2-deoxy-alpha-D-glucopyranoside deacetylase